jgi:hypothetical protein
MSVNQKIPLKRISIEAIAVVGSILLAFAIDAWWQERQERQEETEQLSRLHAEFSVNIERVDGYRDRHVRVQQATEEIFEIIQAAQDKGQSSADLPSVIIRQMIQFQTFEADTPVLDGLVRSGALEIIESRELIGFLAGWESSVRDYTELALRARRNIDFQLIPALSTRGDFGPALMLAYNIRQPESAELSPTHVTKMAIDNEFKMLVANRYQNGQAHLRALGRLTQAAESVIESIEATQSE